MSSNLSKLSKLRKIKTSPTFKYLNENATDLSPNRLLLFREVIKDTYNNILQEKSQKYSFDFERREININQDNEANKVVNAQMSLSNLKLNEDHVIEEKDDDDELNGFKLDFKDNKGKSSKKLFKKIRLNLLGNNKLFLELNKEEVEKNM